MDMSMSRVNKHLRKQVSTNRDPQAMRAMASGRRLAVSRHVACGSGRMVQMLGGLLGLALILAGVGEGPLQARTFGSSPLTGSHMEAPSADLRVAAAKDEPKKGASGDEAKPSSKGSSSSKSGSKKADSSKGGKKGGSTSKAATKSGKKASGGKPSSRKKSSRGKSRTKGCLLYTSDAADE